MHYRETAVNGGTYFFTVNLAHRHQTWLVDWMESLRAVIRRVRHRHPFRIDAMVILPDHLHALWTLPAGDRDYAKRWTLIKGGLSRRIRNRLAAAHGRRSTGGEIWQRRYWDYPIRDEQEYDRHVQYIHYDPVKHGYVPQAADWPHSSVHRYIAAGMLPSDWGAVWMDVSGSYGER